MVSLLSGFETPFYSLAALQVIIKFFKLISHIPLNS